MSSPRVAVVIPAHNRSDLLAITLRNVAAQTLEDIEIIVVDDASADDTPEVIQNWVLTDSRHKSRRFNEPHGACHARNVGIEMTTAEYICLLDSDDLLHPEKLSRQVAELDADPNLDAAVCQMAHFEQDPNDAQILWNTFVGDTPRRRFLSHEPVWGIHAPLWRQQVLVQLGGLDDTLPMAQDYELHVRALVKGVRFGLRPELLTFCRRHQGPAISTGRALPRLQTLDRVFRSMEPLVEQDELSVLATNHVWLAKQAAGWRDVGLINSSFERARALGAALPAKFRLLCLLAAWTGRHRFMRMAMDVAESQGHDLGQRENWYHRHRIADEPNLDVPAMPAYTF